jgi:hypothetical protein
MARWLGFVLAAALSSASAQGARKALAIGAEARPVAEKLTALGFELTRLEKGGLSSGVAAYLRSLQAGDESFVIHSGPSLQERGENFLYPPTSAGAGYALDRLLGALEGKKLLVSLVVIDPRPAPPGRAKAQPRPLRPVAVGPGAVVALAAQPGKSPEEPGRGRPTVFAAALAEHLDDPVDVRQMLQAVADVVASRTDHSQRPWVTAHLARPYALLPSAAAAVSRAPVEARSGRCSGEDERRLDSAERKLLGARRRIEELDAQLEDVPEKVEKTVLEDGEPAGKVWVPNPRFVSLQRKLSEARRAKGDAHDAFDKIKLRCD